MTMSPFEVERREFGTATFGYRKREVDEFVTEVHGTLGKLWEERSELREELERVSERVERYAAQESQLVSTLRLAQESAEKATEHARKEAELVLREAQQQSRDLVHLAHEERQQLDTVVRELRAAEREARQRLRSLATAVLTGIDDDDPATEAQARSLRATVSGVATPTSSAAGSMSRRSQPARRDSEAPLFGRPPRFERTQRAVRDTQVDAPSEVGSSSPGTAAQELAVTPVSPSH